MENAIKLPLPVTLEGKETERIYFRKLTGNDLDILMPFFSSEKAMEFFPYTVSTEEFAKSWINRQLNRYNKYRDGLYGLINKSTNELVGMCGLLLQEVDGMPELEIGYHLLPAHWKKGYATEAAQFCKSFASENKLAPSIISIIDINNINSQRVAERNGLKREKQTTFTDLPVYIYRAAL